MTTRRRGVTLIDCLVLLAVAAAVAPIAMTALQQNWERANRAECADNLRRIGQAMRQYGIDDIRRGGLPRTTYDVHMADEPRFGTPYAADDALGPQAGVDPFLTERSAGDDPDRKALLKYVPAANDVTASLWHLMRASDLTPADFVCPSTRREPFAFPDGMDETSYTNWPGVEAMRGGLSYSVHNMYPDAAAVTRGAKWTDTLRASFAVAADINPGGKAVLDPAADPLAANSPNHFGAGQNVLYADGAILFAETPLAGREGDNIYAHAAIEGRDAGVVGPMAGPSDNVLLPTAEQLGQPAPTLPTDAEIGAMPDH